MNIFGAGFDNSILVHSLRGTHQLYPTLERKLVTTMYLFFRVKHVSRPTISFVLPLIQDPQKLPNLLRQTIKQMLKDPAAFLC